MAAKDNIAVALTIAGSDSGGGAGVQADLRAFSAFGVFGCSAITALTSQNPLEVRRVDAVPVKGVSAQIETVADAVRVSAVKTGMLYGASTVKAVAACLSKLNLPLVVDPVAVSTSGAPLLKPDAVGALRSKLLPLATWATPNIPEAELLTGMDIRTEQDMLFAAFEIHRLWGCSCVVKGGHFKGDAKRSSDIVCHEGVLYRLSTPRVKVLPGSDHGTGCSFSAALTALLAKGESWDKALLGAKSFIYASLASPVRISSKLYAMLPSVSGPSFKVSAKLDRLG